MTDAVVSSFYLDSSFSESMLLAEVAVVEVATCVEGRRGMRADGLRLLIVVLVVWLLHQARLLIALPLFPVRSAREASAAMIAGVPTCWLEKASHAEKESHAEAVEGFSSLETVRR